MDFGISGSATERSRGHPKETAWLLLRARRTWNGRAGVAVARRSLFDEAPTALHVPGGWRCASGHAAAAVGGLRATNDRASARLFRRTSSADTARGLVQGASLRNVRLISTTRPAGGQPRPGEVVNYGTWSGYPPTTIPRRDLPLPLPMRRATARRAGGRGPQGPQLRHAGSSTGCPTPRSRRRVTGCTTFGSSATCPEPLHRLPLRGGARWVSTLPSRAGSRGRTGLISGLRRRAVWLNRALSDAVVRFLTHEVRNYQRRIPTTSTTSEARPPGDVLLVEGRASSPRSSST